MKQTEEKKKREVYIAPVVSDIAPVTVTKGESLSNEVEEREVD